MTTTNDTPAVIEANRVLAADHYTLGELQDSRDAIVNELRELESMPDIRPEQALSVAEHEHQKAERESIILRKRICRDLHSRLNERLAFARAADAVATAADDRQLLEDSLTAADDAMHQLDIARRSAVLAAQALADKRKHVNRGDRAVGATAEQMSRLFELHGIHEDPEHQYRDRHKEGELKRLRNQCQIPVDHQPDNRVEPEPAESVSQHMTTWPGHSVA